MPAFPNPRPKLKSNTDLNDSDKTFTVDADETWQILWIHVEYTASATVGNRRLSVRIRDASDDAIFEMRAAATQAADELRDYRFAPGLPREASFVDATILCPLPNVTVLPAGWDVRVMDQSTVDAAADDMIVHMMVYTWPITIDPTT